MPAPRSDYQTRHTQDALSEYSTRSSGDLIPTEMLKDILDCVVANYPDASASDAPGGLGDIRAHLDAQALALDRASAHLKARRNALVPVSRLPPEILSAIFLDLRDAYCSEQPHPKRGLEWTRIVQVSHHWREVALGTPALWDDVDCWRPFWAEEAVVRSQTSMLTLRLVKTDDQSKDPKQLSLIPPLAGRVRHIRFRGFSIKELGPCIATTQPSLETMHISCQAPASRAADSTFSAKLLGSQFPSLRRLRMEGCFFIGNSSPLLSNITHLHLACSPSGRWQPSHMAVFLNGAQNVEVLTLQWPGPGQLVVSRAAEAIQLPRLRLLEIEDDARSCGVILKCLPLPCERLKVHVHNACVSLLRPVLDYVGKLWLRAEAGGDILGAARLKSWPLSTSHSGTSFCASVEAAGVQACFGGVDSLAEARGRLQLIVEDESRSDAQKLMRYMCEDLPMKRVSVLHLAGTVSLDDTLGSVPQVQTLHVDCGDLGKMAVLSQKSHALVPSLRTLVVHPRGALWVHPREIKDWLVSRRDGGFGVTRLAVWHRERKSEEVQNWLDSLEGVVDDVAFVGAG